MLSLICGDLRLICGDLRFSGRPRYSDGKSSGIKSPWYRTNSPVTTVIDNGLKPFDLSVWQVLTITLTIDGGD